MSIRVEICSISLSRWEETITVCQMSAQVKDVVAHIGNTLRIRPLDGSSKIISRGYESL
jgi:hypothetical protein